MARLFVVRGTTYALKVSMNEKNNITTKQIEQKLNVTYNGPMAHLDLWTDSVTRSTFATLAGATTDEVRAKLDETRKKFTLEN